jgi:pimeloyl-ACP methyl ester carboxylesterase
MSMSVTPCLYLHGGPAMGAAMERALLPQLSHCHWWDQPRPAADSPHAYQDVLAAAEAELQRLFNLHGQPLALVANSFGAVLAAHLARVMPAKVARLVLLAPVSELEQGVMRVAQRVLAFSAEPAPALQAALSAYQAAPTRARYWEVFQVMLQHPDLAARYWMPGSPRAAWFTQMLALPEMFDMAAHVAIADDYQRAPLLPQPGGYDGPVELVFGVGDPLTDPAAAVQWWRQCYPQASARLVPAAHFPHLELPDEAIRIFGV